MSTISIPSKKKLHNAWAMYDWANSAYNLVITSTVFPAYYYAITTIEEGGITISDKVSFFGWNVTNSALFMYATAFAYLLIAIISPILSSIADVKGNKKAFLRFFSTIGALACAGMYFFTLERLEWGIICFMVAAIGFCGSLVFYNAYLPEIAAPQERDRLSAKGFAYGYVGCVTLQLICFIFILKPEWFGQDTAWGSRFSFLLVGIWWLSFTQIPLRVLPNNTPKAKTNENIIAKGFSELRKVWNQLRQIKQLKAYLTAFFFYSMGVQTVMLAATLFGTKELHLSTGQLITSILLIQIVAIGGAFLMSKLSTIFGNLKVLFAVVIIWIAVCVAAYFVQTAMHFYIIATAVGLVMGGIQSLSRSTYANLMPKTEDTTSFFSFYDITEKVAIVIGMFSFGFIDQLTGNMRNSIGALIIFFLIGLVFLYIADRHRSATIRQEL